MMDLEALAVELQSEIVSGFDAVHAEWKKTCRIDYVESFKNPDGTPRADTYAKMCVLSEADIASDVKRQIARRVGRASAQHVARLVNEICGASPGVVTFVGKDPYPKIELSRCDEGVAVRCYHDFGIERV